MFKNYFKIAIRNLTKNKLHSGINLVGLSLGLGVSILIFFFVQFEMNFDDFHQDKDRIFRLQRHEKFEGEVNSSFSTPVITAPTFAGEFAQVTHATQLVEGSAQAYLDESTTQNQEFTMVSPDFLEIFSFELIAGEKSQALKDKFSAVLTESVAKKYFADANPVGKSIRLKMGENYEEYQVTGILEDIPPNSSIRFEMLINNLNADYSISKESQNSWFNVFGDTYIKLTGSEAKTAIEAGVDGMMKKVLGKDYVEGDYYFTLQPMADIHLSDEPNSGMAETTRPSLLWILTGIAFLILLITAMAGAYPAFFMSSLQPIKVLKGNLSIRYGKQALRKGLVAFQFFISFLLIASTLIMVNQMNAIRNYDLGFDQEMVVLVDVPDVPNTSFVVSIREGFAQAELYRQALAARTEVKSAGITVSTYGDNAFWDGGFPTEDGKQFNFRLNFVGGDYVKTMGLEMAEGRELNPLPGSDSSAVLINETFAKAMKWDDPLGELLPSTQIGQHQIVGVVKDFHHNSLYKEIEPVILAKDPATIFSGINMLMINSATNPKVIVKGTGTDFEAFRAILESEWKKVFPLEAFSFSFMDEAVESQYRADERLGKMVFFAAAIAILIAAMGLLAMAALSIAGRTKEIGIRKVLGASSLSISWMFNKEFLFITLVGVIIALPLSWYLMQGWIAQFSVKEWPSWLSFLILTLVGIGFTLAIVSAQSYRATQMNPVDTLKDE